MIAAFTFQLDLFFLVTKLIDFSHKNSLGFTLMSHYFTVKPHICDHDDFINCTKFTSYSTFVDQAALYQRPDDP